MEEPAVPRRGLGCLGADPNTPSDYIKYEQGCERSAGGAVALQCYLHLLEKTKIAQIMSNSLLKCEWIKWALPTPTLIELYFTEFQNSVYSGHLKMFSEQQF